MMKRVVVLAGILCFWAAPGSAQTCLGSVSFGMAPVQAGALGAFTSDSHSVMVGAGAGNDMYFGRGAFQWTGFSSSSGIDASAKGILGTAGAEFKVDSEKRVAVCPVVNVL